MISMFSNIVNNYGGIIMLPLAPAFFPAARLTI